MNNFLIYRASAGTGKTFSLVKEYLAVILKEPDGFRHTLAITFTNKAAEEMKSRILSHLTHIADGRDESKAETWQAMVPALLEATGMDEDQLVRNAGITLGNILHNYSFFSVGTIDSFSHALVQTFAREMDLPLNFELELDSKDMIAKAIDRLIAKVGEDTIVTKILVAYLRHKISENTHLNIVGDLNDFAGKTLREEGLGQRRKLTDFEPQDLLEKGADIKEALRRYEQEVLRIAKPVWEKIRFLCHAFSQGERGIAGFFKKLSRHPLSFPSTIYAQKTIDENKWFAGKASSAEKAEIEALQPFIESAYEELSSLLNKNRTRIIIFQEIRKNLHSMMLLNEIDRTMMELREESGIVHISELNKRIADVVHKESVPFIYERIGARYRNYLIDEFQDTSVLQWNNFIPLILNALSENGLSMIVGDGKQAIYRWRSGDVEQFERLSALTEQHAKTEPEKMFKRHLKLQHLKQNFRSDKTVVDFNNRLFEYVKQYIPQEYKELANVYSDLKLEALPGKPQGFVSVDFIAENEERSYEEAMCEAVFTKIGQLRERGFEYAEVAVLCRSNKESSVVAQYLIDRRIPVASSDSLSLTSSEEVNLLCAALNYIALPDASNGAIFWLQLWKTKNIPWSDTFMENINPLNRKQFQTFLKEQGFDIDFKVIAKSTLFDAAVLLINAFGMDAAGNMYVRFFLDGLIDAQSGDISSVNDFPGWWEKTGKKQSLIIPENSNAVKVMTIHKAKGLGFPVVIYPFASEKFKKSVNDIWVDLDPEEYFFPSALLPLNTALKETGFAPYYHEERAKSSLDMLNVFYVACTRPKKELHIISKYQEKWKNENPSIAEMLHNFLEAEGWWDDAILHYSFGTPATNEKKTDALREEIRSNALNKIIPWQERAVIRRYSQQFWSSEQMDYGNLIHHILEKIKTASDIKPILQRLSAAGALSREAYDRIEPVLQKVIRHPELQPFFTGEYETFQEISVLLPENREIRPDRILISDNQVHLLDYKTGNDDPEHKKQLLHYAGVVAQMGYDVASARLVYINDRDVSILNIIP